MSGVSDAWAGAAPDRPGTCRALSPEGGQERGGPGVGEAAGLMWTADLTRQLWQVESWVEGKGVLQAGLRGAGASRGGQAASGAHAKPTWRERARRPLQPRRTAGAGWVWS